MTVYTKARIPVVMDAVITVRMDLDLDPDIKQGSNRSHEYGCNFTASYPDCYRITPAGLSRFKRD